MKIFAMIVLLASIQAQAKIHCEIYDLATADIFASADIRLSAKELRTHGAELKLQHELVQSEFYIYWNQNLNVFDFKIHSQEFTSETSSLFQLRESQFSKKFKMGFNSIELTGLGDNVHSRCEWTP